MRRIRRVGVLGCLSMAVLSGTATAAPGGAGALVLPSPCSLSLPGGFLATGEGTQIVLPNGSELVRCDATLVPGSPVPSRTVTISAGDCLTVVTPTGHVVGHCRPSRP